jgi:multidrug efflux system membrane fusion protein
MFRHALSLAVPVSLIALLVACGNGETVEAPVRPAMVVQPQPAGDAMETYPGEVRARFEPELAFRIGGKISKRLVDAGARVKKDQPLAELDPEDVKLQLEAARAQVAAAEANLKLVRTERDRYQTLLARQLISQSQYDNVENQYRAGEARVKQIKAEFNVANNQAGYSVLRASQDGVIARRLAEVGQVVSAGQTVFTLAADGEREVLISVPEHAFERFRIGQDVSVELWSQPGKRFPGRIRELSPAADAQSRTFAARVAFAGGAMKAELGQSARVAIKAEGEVPLSVPMSALSAEKDVPFVWVVDPKESKVVRTLVRIGRYGQERVSVLEGLKEGDWVVAAGVQMLRDGQKVKPVDRDNRTVKLIAGE